MNFFQRIKIDTTMTSLVYIVLGILFVIFPGIAMSTICYLLASGLLLLGAGYVIDYFRFWQTNYASNGLTVGILALLGALFLFLKADTVIAAIPVLLGFAVIVSGVLKIQNAIVLYKTQVRAWLYVLIAAALCVVLGIVLIENPFAAASTLVTLIGVGMIFSGVSDLIIMWLLSRKIKKSL